MTTETNNTAEWNRRIAKFLGYTIKGDIVYRRDNINTSYIDELQYHTSWDWLIPVVEKIESRECEVYIMEQCCEIWEKGKMIPIVDTVSADTKLSATYQAVCAFIKQFNEKKNL